MLSAKQGGSEKGGSATIHRGKTAAYKTRGITGERIHDSTERTGKDRQNKGDQRGEDPRQYKEERQAEAIQNKGDQRGRICGSTEKKGRGYTKQRGSEGGGSATIREGGGRWVSRGGIEGCSRGVKLRDVIEVRSRGV